MFCVYSSFRFPFAGFRRVVVIMIVCFIVYVCKGLLQSLLSWVGFCAGDSSVLFVFIRLVGLKLLVFVIGLLI